MNQVYVHLIISHLPIIGTLLGLLVLIYALWVRSHHTQIAAYALFVISSLGAVVAYLSGAGAEDAVEHLQGVTKSVIERHENFSVYALVALIVLGVASIVGIALTLKKSKLSRMASTVILILSIVGFGLIGWTGYLGGLIRHTEINTPVMETQVHDPHEHDHEAITEVQLNNGEKWQADATTNQGIIDLIALTNSSKSNSNLKDTLMGRINQIFDECTMTGESDKQLHNYLLPLINKIGQLDQHNADNKLNEIHSYLNTYQDYFK